MKIRTSDSRAGFTLVEIMIVVAIIGLLLGIALPSFVKARKRAQATAFVACLRVASDAFTMRAAEAGQFPPDGMPGGMPAGMGPYLAKMAWAERTPIGGRWDWDNGQFGFKAGVSVYQPDRTPQEMEEIDAMIDDGDLSKGAFRSRADGYISILEP
jgi:prepilin-type N-terminal cleavage/methylation domain-containing protein